MKTKTNKIRLTRAPGRSGLDHPLTPVKVQLKFEERKTRDTTYIARDFTIDRNYV